MRSVPFTIDFDLHIPASLNKFKPYIIYPLNTSAIMKKLTFLLAALCLSCASFAQSNVSFGNPYSSVDAPYNRYFYHGNEILSVKAESKKLVLQKLNSTTLNEISSKSFVDFPANYKVEYTTESNGKFYLFYSVSAKNNVQVYAREIDFTQGAFAAEAKQVVNTAGELVKHSSIGFRSSYDHSNLLLFYSLNSTDKKTAVMQLQVLSSTLETQWKNEFKIARAVQQLDFAVDAEGIAYLLTQNENASIDLMVISATENSTKAVLVDKKTIRKIGLFETAASGVLCAGFYNKDIHTSAAGGLFVLNAKNLNEAITCDISQSVMHQYTSSEQQHNPQLILKQVLQESDGSLTLIGESQCRITTRYYTPKGHARKTYSSHYDDILITKINATGDLAWMKKLPKRQSGKASDGQGQMSYRYMASGTNHYLIFLDNENNQQVSLDDAPTNYVNRQSGLLTAYEISKDKGEVTKLPILNTNDDRNLKTYKFTTDKIIPIDTTGFVLELSKKGNEDVLMKTVFAQ